MAMVQLGNAELTGAVAIAASAYHSLPLRNDGMVWAWDRNSDGQLGDGSTAGTHVPVRIDPHGSTGPLSPLGNVAAIAAGGFHRLALKDDGTVWAWGRNTEGQLGNGTVSNRPMPVRVTDLANVAAIAAGARFSLALERK